ncbi:FkbM family methyltransferase [Microbulbifer hydrolyticus]|uniref:FkbM family methyltransferase n=1 Tax=Microbulbifer hydrolyticus TaxID=48074 RepID=A0A6P1T810_9GAMM|nr:FkbM family methyltransferase [Microbulbifer hydrolyticus]MBB5210600.1 FkbM family methyltransferase [Microbulbifer hydrolyticus]QHQ38934.1 FkbM family methyltransferase [Microbulbifer hydrolyticus]
MMRSQFFFLGKKLTFFVGNPDDAIQKQHLKGTLFDHVELLKMARYISDGDLILDVGTNVGNHAVYFSRFFPSSKVMVFEPNPDAIRILEKNLDANGCSNVDRSGIGIGLSDKEAGAMSWRGGDNNLGGSRVIPTVNLNEIPEKRRKNFSHISLMRGDSLVEGDKVGFIKIDVEGHEILVLSGLERTVANSRPTLFVEVDKSNDERFKSWLVANGYHVVWVDNHYKKVTNYLCVPNSEKFKWRALHEWGLKLRLMQHRLERCLFNARFSVKKWIDSYKLNA